MNSPQKTEAREPVAPINAAIVYHFFANYRKPILNKLSESENVSYLFVADRVNRIMPGVKTWAPESSKHFRFARCIPLVSGFMLQMGLLKLAWDKHLDCIIFLGDWKWPSTWTGAVLAKLRGKRVLFWTHGWRTPDTGFKKWIRKLFYHRADGMLLYGNRARQIAIDQGFAANSLYVVFNSLDHSTHVQLRKKYCQKSSADIRSQIFDGDTKSPVVICSARLLKRKRLSELLSAIAKLRAKNHPVNVILIGDGEDKTNLESQAKELGINVHFEGSCFDEQRISDLTMASNLTVSPGPIGLTAIQSLGFGVPVVTNDDMSTQGPECEAIVPGVTGDLFENENADDLAEKIRAWTGSSQLDNGVRQQCMAVIDRFYNPNFQEKVFYDAIRGVPAQTYLVKQAIQPATMD